MDLAADDWAALACAEVGADEVGAGGEALGYVLIFAAMFAPPGALIAYLAGIPWWKGALAGAVLVPAVFLTFGTLDRVEKALTR